MPTDEDFVVRIRRSCEWTIRRNFVFWSRSSGISWILNENYYETDFGIVEVIIC